MTEAHHREFYSSSKTMTYAAKESHFSSSLFSKDSVDACFNSTRMTVEHKHINGQTKFNSFESTRQEITNGKETKSFIQQRVERLYGPGALAQGFFVMKRQKSRTSESDLDRSDPHSKSMVDRIDHEEAESVMKQSVSSPTLPVLRHLRPEFRAQLPIISSRKGSDGMQKSPTVPTLKDETVNGHGKTLEPAAEDFVRPIVPTSSPIKEESVSDAKDGHYFLRVLDKEAQRLLGMADKVEQEMDMVGMSEEIKGKLRSASGKARLLVSQKMQQFKGLCSKNITQVQGEQFPTTSEDLQGFWDMVMLQVDQVDQLFKEIDELRNNNWNEIAEVKLTEAKSTGSVKVRKAAPRPKPNSVNELARKQREAERKKLIEERRKAMKAQQQNKPKDDIEIFVPETS